LRICILGSAPSSRDLAPLEDKSVEIWTIAQMTVDRADRVFELHNLDHLKGYYGDSFEEILSTKYKHNPPFITIEPIKVQNRVEYPLEEVNKLLNDCGAGKDYLMSTIGYMIAYAILQSPKEIMLYGVDMAASDEYAYQRANCEFLLGVAAGRGIKITVPEQSKLLKCRARYGSKEAMAKIDPHYPLEAKNLTERLERHKAVLAQNDKQLIMIEGALLTLSRMAEASSAITIDKAFLEKELAFAKEAQGKANLACATMAGSIKEIEAELMLINHYNLGGH
jgi:hypothetical protein